MPGAPHPIPFSVNSKTFLITGCTSGLGLAIARAALVGGHRVIATARDIHSIADLERDGSCHLEALDITDAAQVRSVVERAAQVWGTLDVLVNNAGYGLLGAVEECGDDQIRRNVETNFFGPLNMIRAALPILRGQGSGHIVNVSAAAAISNYAGLGIYGAAKAALELMSESLRAELAPLGIRVMLVQPGPFRTGFIARGMERAADHIGAYDATVGRFKRTIEALDGKQPGDPGRAARAILSAIECDNPPFRLALGKYANEKVRRTVAGIEAERAAGEHLGLTADFPPAP